MVHGLACVGGVGVSICGACVSSGFLGVCSPAGFSVRVFVPVGGGCSPAVVMGVCPLCFVACVRPGFVVFLVVFVFVGFWVVFFLFFEFSFCLLNFLLV